MGSQAPPAQGSTPAPGASAPAPARPGGETPGGARPADPAATQRIQPQRGWPATEKLSPGQKEVPPGPAKPTEKFPRARPAPAPGAGGGPAAKTAGLKADSHPGASVGDRSRADKLAGKDKPPAQAKRRRGLKVALLLIAVLAIAGVGLSVQNQNKRERALENGAPRTSASPSARAPVKVGEVVERANLQALVVRRNTNFTHPDPAIKPEEGKKFVAVEFKLTNRDTKAVKVSAARQFKLKDSSDARYDISPIGAPDPKFPDATLAPGQTVSGWIAFQIPKEAKGLRLLFSPRVSVDPGT